jgi:hypothetical protein
VNSEAVVMNEEAIFEIKICNVGIHSMELSETGKLSDMTVLMFYS